MEYIYNEEFSASKLTCFDIKFLNILNVAHRSCPYCE